MMVTVTKGICALTLAAACATTLAGQIDQFSGIESLRLERDETYVGDRYVIASSISIEGRHEGDLIALGKRIRIDGVLTGDGILGGESLQIDGEVLDSVRFFGGSATVTGTIDGDLLFLGQELDVPAEGHITGNLVLLAGVATIDGTVDGEVRGAVGKVVLGGVVGRDVSLEVDTIRLRPGARIGGDLVYESRKEISIEGEPNVGGQIIYERTPEEDKKSAFSKFNFWWFFFTFSAMVVGLILLALLRRLSPAMVRPVDNEALLGILIGFGTFLIVPAAAVLSMVLVISIPFALLTLIVFFVTLYLAKIPVALWVGRRIMRIAGRSDPSPLVAFALGILVLYLLFTLPYLGTLIWLATTWLGLGTIILAVRSRLQEQRALSAG